MWRTLYHLQLVLPANSALEMKKKIVAKLFPDHALNLKCCERGGGVGRSFAVSFPTSSAVPGVVSRADEEVDQ